MLRQASTLQLLVILNEVKNLALGESRSFVPQDDNTFDRDCEGAQRPRLSTFIVWIWRLPFPVLFPSEGRKC